MSYLERTLYWYLKTQVFGGIEKLRHREYIPFIIMILSIMLANTSFTILYMFNMLITLEFVQNMLVLELFISFAIIVSGILIGKIKNLLVYYIVSIIVIFGFIVAFFYVPGFYSNIFFQLMKLIYFLIWVVITSISMFFLTLYFFTSFPKKVITLGMPKEHIFLDSIIKVVLLTSIPLYIYIISQFTLGNLIVGILGIINVLITIILVYKAPKKVDSVPGIVNFVSAIGFFILSVFYHLISSFSSLTTSASSFLMDVLLLFFTVLYIVQSLTRRISDTPASSDALKSPVQFQSRVYFTDRLKRLLGERGVILTVIGIAMGYHMVVLDSFFITEVPFFSVFLFPGLNFSTIYHRVYLLFSILLCFIFFLVFKFSKHFKEFMVDKYTINQVLKYIGAYFQKSDGSPSLFEIGVQEFGKKIDESIKNLGDKWKKSRKSS